MYFKTFNATCMPMNRVISEAVALMDAPVFLTLYMLVYLTARPSNSPEKYLFK